MIQNGGRRPISENLNPLPFLPQAIYSFDLSAAGAAASLLGIRSRLLMP